AFFFLLPAFAVAAEKVGVIAVGSDPTAAGALQLSLERRLRAEPSIELKGALDLAPKLGLPPAAGTWQGDAAARGQVTSLLGAVQAAYYAEKREEAGSRLGELAKLLDGLADAPAAVRTKVPLWRAAIHAKEGR